jgi:hypothetical protein
MKKIALFAVVLATFSLSSVFAGSCCGCGDKDKDKDKDKPKDGEKQSFTLEVKL